MLITGATKESNNCYNQLKLLNVELGEISKLKPHELIDKGNSLRIKGSLINEGIKLPIVVDENSNIILDGHHRYNIFKELNLKVIPVYYVDYFDKKIIVDSWNGTSLTKNDVVRIANSGRLFPNKTTKHMFKSKAGLMHISSIAPRIDLNIHGLIGVGGKGK